MFNLLINGVNNFEYVSVIIDNYKVEIVPNIFSDRGLCALMIDGTMSNSCLPQTMKRLIREWELGKRHVSKFDDGLTLLMKSYN